MWNRTNCLLVSARNHLPTAKYVNFSLIFQVKNSLGDSNVLEEQFEILVTLIYLAWNQIIYHAQLTYKQHVYGWS